VSLPAIRRAAAADARAIAAVHVSSRQVAYRGLVPDAALDASAPPKWRPSTSSPRSGGPAWAARWCAPRSTRARFRLRAPL
jgi:hypothetical protein